jgi:hypothetical protein
MLDISPLNVAVSKSAHDAVAFSRKIIYYIVSRDNTTVLNRLGAVLQTREA